MAIGQSAPHTEATEQLRLVRMQLAAERRALEFLIADASLSESFRDGLGVAMESVERIGERLENQA